MLVHARLDESVQKIMFADGHWARAEGSQAVIDESDSPKTGRSRTGTRPRAARAGGPRPGTSLGLMRRRLFVEAG